VSVALTTATEAWKAFQACFAKELSNTSSERLVDAWTSQTRRTLFYIEDLLPRVAREMGLGWETELLAVDCAMSLPGARVPGVFLESENIIGYAFSEVRKFCCLSVPVRVLLTVGEWDETEGVWPNGGFRSRMLRSWQAIISAHAEAWPTSNVFGILVGEWREPASQPPVRASRLRFYSYLLDSSGSLSNDQPEILFERSIVEM